MKTYLDAHAAFVNWLDGAAQCEPTAAEVEKAMVALAARAADRGMSADHWRFVVDGLIAHARRKCPKNAALPDFVARGFDFSARWDSIARAASQQDSRH
jgi:hypothetical protein